MLRRKPQPAMVMTMQKTTSLNISVAESEAKLDASSCHPFVGGEATSTLMTRSLILAIYCRNLRIALFQKLWTHKAVKKSSTRIYQSTPYSSPHRISTSPYTQHTITKEGRRVYVPLTGRNSMAGEVAEQRGQRHREVGRPATTGERTASPREEKSGERV
jgi:hypothetical protein